MLIDLLLLIKNHFQHPSSCEAYGEELYQNCKKKSRFLEIMITKNHYFIVTVLDV